MTHNNIQNNISNKGTHISDKNFQNDERSLFIKTTGFLLFSTIF